MVEESPQKIKLFTHCFIGTTVHGASYFYYQRVCIDATVYEEKYIFNG